MVETELIITLWAHIHCGFIVTMRCLLLWRVFLARSVVLPQGWGVLGNSQNDFRLHAVWVQLLECSISSVKFNSVSSYMGFYLFICSSVHFGRHFLFSLSLYLETKMLNSLSHYLSHYHLPKLIAHSVCEGLGGVGFRMCCSLFVFSY